MRIVLGMVLLLAVLLVGCSDKENENSGAGGSGDAGSDDDGGQRDSGSHTESVFHADIGDCIIGTEDFKEGKRVSSYQELSCDEPHTYEVFALEEYTGNSFNEDSINAFAQDACEDAYKPYTGQDFDDSKYTISFLIPTEESWNTGDREIVCLVSLIDDTMITGSFSEDAGGVTGASSGDGGTDDGDGGSDDNDGGVSSGRKYPGPCTEEDKADHRWTYTYDENGNVITKEEDNYDDMDRIVTYTYDANGNMLTREDDQFADGTVNSRETYTYDADGNLVTSERDSDADGTVNSSRTYTYDADGNMLTQESWGSEGTLGTGYGYTYDADGNMLTEEKWNDDERNVDERTTWTYDTNGNMLTEEEDYDADGDVEYITTYTYDADGNMLTEETRGGDDTVRSRFTYTYDANGNMLTSEYTSFYGLDVGESPQTRRTTYTYDVGGNLLTLETDFNIATGTVDLRETYTYDCWE